MNALIKRERYTAKLPATPCTPQLRHDLEEIATSEGVPLAELQRFALQFFLQNYDRKTDNEWHENKQEVMPNVN